MAFTTGTGTFTSGSTTVTNVSLSSGTLAYFASGTRMIIGANPVTAEVEAVAAPTVTTITLRSPWPHTGGTYNFLANQTSEGLRDAVQSIRNSNTTLQNYIDSISKAPNADTVVERTSTGAVRAANALNADEAVALGQLPDDVADLYAKNNILGTASQSGGVPTGAIIESDSNSNGYYTKFADGSAVLWRDFDFTGEDINNADDAFGFISGNIGVFLPTYISTVATGVAVRAGGGAFGVRSCGAAGGTSTSSSILILFSNTSQVSVSGKVRIVWIGRWY